MPYDRETWDLTAALYAVRPPMATSPFRAGPGHGGRAGQDAFTPQDGGQHHVLSVNDAQRARILEAFLWLVHAAGSRALGRATSSNQILTPGYRAAIHFTNFSGAAMVESRPCRTNAQSSNLPDCLISASVVGCSRRLVNSSSTIADFLFFGSGRGSPRTVARPTTAELPPL